MNGIPTPEVLSGYEKLGIIGILLLVICVGLVVIVWAVKQIKGVATQFFGFVTEQTRALVQFKDSNETVQDAHLSLHERLDNLFSCTRSGCPVFEMRKKQHKDAVRFSETQLSPQTKSTDSQ